MFTTPRRTSDMLVSAGVPAHLLLLTATATALPHIRLRSVSDPNAQFGSSGQYDQLVLARFWEPQAHPCGSFGAQNLTLHGLWPQYARHHPGAPGNLPGDWPQFCGKNDSKFWNLIQPLQAAVAASFNQQWSSLAPDYASGTLGQHEWEKHGTCYSADILTDPSKPDLVALQMRFFQASLTLMAEFPTPSVLHAAQAAKQEVKLSALQEAFGGSDMAGLSCKIDKATGKRSLSMVEMCFKKDSHGNPTGRAKCAPQTLLASSYDNGCALHTKPSDMIQVDMPCGTQPPPSPAPQGQCVANKHGPRCKTNADCTQYLHCVRCAHSGFCTTVP